MHTIRVHHLINFHIYKNKKSQFELLSFKRIIA